MPKFHYTALDRNGKEVAGELDATNTEESQESQDQKLKEKLKEINESLKKGLEPFVFDPLGNEAIQRIGESVGGIFEQAGLAEVRGVECRPVWTLMKFGDRFKWFIANRVLKWVGREVRRQHDQYLALWYAIADVTDTRKLELPNWAESDPKSIMAVDVVFTPRTPMDKISVNVNITEQP